MKCPKCGYNSFEHLDNCKKCGNSLTAFKESLGLRSLILPAGVAMATVAAAASDAYINSAPVPGNSADDMFQWDMPSPETVSTKESASGDIDLDFTEETKSVPPAASDPFSFEDDLLAATSPQPVPSEQNSDAEFSFELPNNPVAAQTPQEVAISIESPVQTKPEETDNAFGEFSFDFPVNQEAETLPQDEAITTESPSMQVKPDAADTVFGEFSFELPDAQDVSTPHDAEIATKSTELQTAQEDAVFGEFSFDIPNESTGSALENPAISVESPDSQTKQKDVDTIFGEFSFDDPEISSVTPDIADQGDLQAPSDFPFDPFGDLDETAFKEEDSPSVPNLVGELDLDSFLATNEPSSAPKDEASAPGKSPLAGSEFDALFGELEEKK